MKPTILKVYSNFPDIPYDIKKCEDNHLIKISNVENPGIPQFKSEMLTNSFCENAYPVEDSYIDSNKDFSVLEDFYRFQERRNAFIDSKKSQTQINQSNLKRFYERPSFSYTQLIYMAIENSPGKAMTVNDIYNWCELNFPYYANAIHGWKNSLRHNLSINKCFKKITKMGQGGRGSLWIVDPREKQHLVSTMCRANVASFNAPSFIIQTAPASLDHHRIVIGDDHSLDIPQDDTIVFSDDSTSSQIQSDLSLILEEKPVYSWTDTRLPCDYTVPLSPENCSDASETDYNDWNRAMISLEPIFPVKQHQIKSKFPLNPIVTPPSSFEHNYSIQNLQIIIDDPCAIVRHIFHPVINSNASFCTSSDYNDEEWPRTPSPVPHVAQIEPPQSKLKIVKSGLKRGRPKNSTKRELELKKSQKPQKKLNHNDRINNMYNLNSFINSL
uniref:Forkhead box N2/3-2 n=1 Tax=Schmidtea mediterranea TaxID=79327 RepID=A0A822ZV60_SCHMD|nr:TPA_exp: forkhead box N2/3-2 [Schmidtea mediterranea]